MLKLRPALLDFLPPPALFAILGIGALAAVPGAQAALSYTVVNLGTGGKRGQAGKC